MYRSRPLLALIVAALIGTRAGAEEQPLYFMDTARFTPDVVRFYTGTVLGAHDDHPSRSVLVVYRGDRKAQSGGVVRFKLDEQMDCSKKQLITSYTTYAESGAVITRLNVAPEDARLLTDPTPYDWNERCMLSTGQRLPPPPYVPPSYERSPIAHGLNEALALASRRDAEIVAALALPSVGRFVVFDEVGGAVTLIDYDHSELSGSRRHIAWLQVYPLGTAVNYVRAIWNVDCEAKTGAREFSASYDILGAITRLAGSTAALNLAVLGRYGELLQGACALDRPGLFEREYRSLDAAVLRGKEPGN